MTQRFRRGAYKIKAFGEKKDEEKEEEGFWFLVGSRFINQINQEFN